jgi:Uma2 family endonuclease
MVRSHTSTIEDYERFILLPENEDRRFEYIEGEVVEVVSNSYSSRIAARILGRMLVYVERQKLGYITGADGGYEVGANRLMPDVGFVSKQRQPEPTYETFNPLAPDLAVEVLSPTDRPRKIYNKIKLYLEFGTVVWLVDPEEKEIDVFIPGQAEKTLRIGDTLDGGSVLPGFSLPLADIFEA